MVDFLLKAAVLGLIAYAVWSSQRRRYTLTIDMDENGVRRHAGLPKAHEARVLAFLEQNVKVQGKLRIRAGRQRNGYFALTFRGPIDRGSEQRIRNYLISIL